MKIYGVLDQNDCQIDVSRSLSAAKRYATANGYSVVSYRIEYYVTIIAERIKGKWYKIDLNDFSPKIK